MTKQKTTTVARMLAELKTLAKSAKENIWMRIQLAEQVLADPHWVEDSFAGDQIAARDRLQKQYFHELHKTFTLGTLLQIYATFPEERMWHEHDFNLSTMRALWEEQTKKEKDPAPRNNPIPRKEHDRVLALLEDAESGVEALEKRCAALQEENAQLRLDLAATREQVALLKGKVEGLTPQGMGV